MESPNDRLKQPKANGALLTLRYLFSWFLIMTQSDELNEVSFDDYKYCGCL